MFRSYDNFCRINKEPKQNIELSARFSNSDLNDHNIGCAFLKLSFLYFFHIKIAFFCQSLLSINQKVHCQSAILNYFSDLSLLFILFKSKNAHICFTSLICNNWFDVAQKLPRINDYVERHVLSSIIPLVSYE